MGQTSVKTLGEAVGSLKNAFPEGAPPYLGVHFDLFPKNLAIWRGPQHPSHQDP